MAPMGRPSEQPLREDTPAWLATRVTDMRRGLNMLPLLVQKDFGHNLHAGNH